jgi:MFS family permease
MAPRQVPLFHKSRKKRPGEFFFQHWRQYLFGKWPLLFPHKQGFLVGGALLYAVVMFLTVIWHSAQVEPTFPLVLFGTAVGLGSALTWWASVSFAVTVNEHRWFVGGYGTLLFYLAWHGIVVLWFRAIFGQEIHPLSGTAKIYYLISDLFLLFIVLIIYGCNASQAIIAIAEPLRQENERSDIRQAIRVFQEFKVKTFGVSLYNYIPMVSARPGFYYWIFGGALIIVAVNIFWIIVTAGDEGFNPWLVVILRNLLVLALMAWSMIWYASAFSFLQKEVYKR